MPPRIRPGRGDTIAAVKIVIYGITFAVVIGIAAAIAGLSLSVAPAAVKSSGLGALAVVLSGLAVAGGVVYLAEKLINLAKEVALMVAQLIVEKYKQHRWEAGRKIGIKQGLERGREQGLEQGTERGLERGRDERQREWESWHERQQAALREGRPFDEPTPGHSPKGNDNGKGAA